MKKKFVLFLVLVLLFVLPVFAKGDKEKTGKSVKSEPVSEIVEIKEDELIKDDASVSGGDVASTSLSTPVYRVELTEVAYITKEDIEGVISNLSSYYGNSVSEDDAAEYLINQILFNQALIRALNNGDIPLYDGTFNDYVSYQLSLYASYYGIQLTTNEEAEAFLAEIGTTFEDFANQVLQDYAEQYYMELNSNGRLENLTEPTEEEILAFYNANKDRFVSDESVQIAHIFISFGEDKASAKVKADTVAKNLSLGLPFEDAVKTYSEDQATKENNGEFGVWIGKNDSGAIESFGSNAMEAIFKLEKGEISEVLEGVQGYHIIKMIDHKDPENLGLDDQYSLNYTYTVSDIIAQQLYSNKQTAVYAEIYNDIMVSLKNEAKIKRLN